MTIKKSTKKSPKKTVTKKKVAKKKSSVTKSVKKVSTTTKTTKKSPVKKTNKRKISRKKMVLISASPDNCFWIQYGPVVKNIFELQDALINITEEQFKHHVNSMKNDFAVWVEEILNDEECAKNIKKAKSTKAMIKAVENALKYY